MLSRSNSNGRIRHVVPRLLASFIVLGPALTLAQVPRSQLATVVPYSSGAPYASSLAIADLNRDGHQDLIVVGGPASRMGVLLGNGDGTFQPPVSYSLASVDSVAIADLNGDGYPDVAVIGYDTVSVLLGKGDGTFQTPVIYNSGGSSPAGPRGQAIAIADVNGDGHPDLIAINECENSNKCTSSTGFDPGGVSVLLGNGDGTFQAPVAYSSGGYIAQSVAIGDLNGDGHPDLVVANSCQGNGNCDLNTFSSPGGVSVLLNKGNGIFYAAANYDSGGLVANSVAIADLNGDGHPDLVVTNECKAGNMCPFNNLPGEVGVLLGKGDGTFQAPVGYSAGGVPSSLAIGEINGDGRPDLVVADWCPINSPNCYPGAVSVLLGNGDGTFQASANHSSGGAYPAGVAIADVDGDGRPDVVVANDYSGTAGVLLNRTHYGSITKVLSSSNPSLIFQPVTFTATVTPRPFPEGLRITFYDGVTAIGSSSIVNGTATFTTSSLSDKTHSIKAAYQGSAFEVASSATVTQVVNRYPSTAALTSNLNPSIYGQQVIFTAHVTAHGPMPPTGTVAFKFSYASRMFTIGSAQLNSSGVATLTKSGLNADPYPMIAVYNGDANNAPSASPVLNQTVLQTKSVASITSSVNPSGAGQAVTFTATITSPTVTPIGPVTFTAGKQVLGTAQIVPWAHKATFTTSTLPVGSTVIRATYIGDSNVAQSAATLTQTIR